MGSCWNTSSVAVVSDLRHNPPFPSLLMRPRMVHTCSSQGICLHELPTVTHPIWLHTQTSALMGMWKRRHHLRGILSLVCCPQKTCKKTIELSFRIKQNSVSKVRNWIGESHITEEKDSGSSKDLCKVHGLLNPFFLCKLPLSLSSSNFPEN